MTITCAIIDDEPLAAGLLESYAKKTPYLELKGVYNSAILAMKDLRDIDYLLKPISYEDFLKSTDKALEWLSISMKQNAYKRDRFMLVKNDYKLQRICLDDILYIEGEKDYVYFVMKSGEKVATMMSLKKLESFLPRPEFLRTHRSYIVHMPETQLIDRFRIVFGDAYIPISEHYKEEVWDFLDQHTLA